MVKNGVIAVFKLQCLPTEPKISTTVTSNPHNICLQAKIIHHIRDRLRQEKIISTSGVWHPNVCGIYIGTGAVVHHQGGNLLRLATNPKVVADYYSLCLIQTPNLRPLH